MIGMDPTEVFVSILGEYARRFGGAAATRLADEIDALPTSRLRVRPRREPITAQLSGCLARGPESTTNLRGAIADLAPSLHWRRAPSLAGQGAFSRRHAYCELVGPSARVPSDRIKVGLFLMSANTVYPPHEHPAIELYLPLSGPVRFGLDFKPPRIRAPGRFVTIGAWKPHVIESLEHTVLMAWAWSGEIDGVYRMSEPR